MAPFCECPKFKVTQLKIVFHVTLSDMLKEPLVLKEEHMKILRDFAKIQ